MLPETWDCSAVALRKFELPLHAMHAAGWKQKPVMMNMCQETCRLPRKARIGLHVFARAS